MTSPRDNYFNQCPAVMDYSMMTDYRSPNRREQYIRTLNNLTTEHEYRLFLQQNASGLLSNEWNYLNMNFNCRPNPCLHNQQNLRTTNDLMRDELTTYNNVRTGKESASKYPCSKMQDMNLNLHQEKFNVL
jgi:hypothetical protein